MKNINVDINGRFYRTNVTGVQRYAHEIIKAIDLILDQEFYARRLKIRLIVPSDSFQLPKLKNIKIYNSKFRGSHLWEQLILPLISFGNPLLSMSGSIPLLKINQFCVIHDAALFDKPEAYKLLFKIFYRFSFYICSYTAKSIFTVSKFSESRLKFFLPHIKEKLIVTYNGFEHFTLDFKCDESLLIKYGLIKGNYYLIVGSHNSNKNIQRIVNLVHTRLSKIGFILVVVGESRPQVFKNSDYLDSTAIKYLGYVNDDNLKSLYLNARAFLFPSVYEGFGIPLLEAMSLGCPILASNAASIPEVCGKNAVYFDPFDDENIYAILSNFHLNKYDISSKHDISLNLLKFSWNNSALKILNAILNKN